MGEMTQEVRQITQCLEESSFFDPVPEDVPAYPRSLAARIWFLLSNLELPVEAFDGHERILYGCLQGNLKLTLLLAKFYEDLLHIFNTKRQEEVSSKEDLFSLPKSQTYIHPHYGLQTLFLSLIRGFASSSKGDYHLF